MAFAERYLRDPGKVLMKIWRVCVACALVLVAGTVLPSAQAPAGRQPSAASPASRAFNAGQFDEVEGLLRSATDPAAIALRARAMIARGRYSDAEKLLTGPAASRPDSDAALELGLLELYLGRRTEGAGRLRLLVNRLEARTAADSLRLARASRALGAFEDANSFFRDANRLAPGNADINAEWGELFLEKHNPGDAMKSFQEALRADESHVPALLGAAKVSVGTNPPAARAALERALGINANSVPAHLLAAELSLDDRERDEAKASIQKALSINPNSLEARSLDAAMAALEDRTADFERLVKEILAINPRFGEVYRVAGDHLARNYRFDEAVLLVRRALALDAENTRAYADLGTHLLRTGDEPGARVALERAFKDDPFDQTTFNQLALLDTIDKFVTITDGDIVMRLHPDEAGVMREHALPLAKEALATLQKHYDFTVTGPILIEMFPKHDDFAVRTIGLPGFIGALGACFGRVVTLDSPNARDPGDFNWGETLWHEIAHVITLQMSKNRLPRWLSEGISVWEERRARPEWGREMDMAFAQAMNEDKVLNLEVLNEGFSDPKLISLAYYQASLVVDHIVDTYGEPALHRFVGGEVGHLVRAGRIGAAEHEGVGSEPAGERIVAAGAGEEVRGVVALDLVREPVAGAVDAGRPGQRQVLEERPQGVRDGALDELGAAVVEAVVVLVLAGDVAGIVDPVAVVPGAAIHGVGARHAVEQIVAQPAEQDVIAAIGVDAVVGVEGDQRVAASRALYVSHLAPSRNWSRLIGTQYRAERLASPTPSCELNLNRSSLRLALGWYSFCGKTAELLMPQK